MKYTTKWLTDKARVKELVDFLLPIKQILIFPMVK